MTELTPCPFCGGKGELCECYGFAAKTNYYVVQCVKCNVRTDIYTQPEQAEEKWNTRVRSTGHWIISPQPDCEPYESNVWQCSVCGEEWQLMEGTPEENHMNYCSQCGAAMNMDLAGDFWILHEGNTGWECPRCHAVIELDKGNPKDKYINHCPVCGLKLELPE